MELVYSVPTVLAFVRQHMPFQAVEGMQAIGMKRGGKMKVGVIYEGFTSHNVWMHVAAVPGARWATREFLRAAFAYPFVQLGVQKVRGYVEARNAAARRFDERLGFRPEAVLEGAAEDGGDVILYVMDRSECRYV
jgi:RimJ/RimL family protein N-acetyltransferase